MICRDLLSCHFVTLVDCQADAASEIIQIRKDEDGSLDEIVSTGGTCHLEKMDSDHWWLVISQPDGETYHINFYGKVEVVFDKINTV